MTTIQVIQFTQHPHPWHALAEALGLTANGEKNDAWTEFDGDGMLALHAVDASDPRVGTAEVWMLVDDDDALADLETQLSAAGIAVIRGAMEGVGATLEIALDPHSTIHAVVGHARAPRGDTAILPLFFTPNVPASTNVATTLELKPRTSSDAGTWADLTAPGGGILALHAEHAAQTPDASPVSLSLEYRGNLDALAERLTDANFENSVVDEAYNRTLILSTPDGNELWVNGAQTDLYGYTEHT
ncbi:hypothetical protein [Paramicrobacterium chengjingii]|uniref:VOC domain-containing protein n=1 Tax=Paramicrobacterium chengjingii TaxID=2769067 RepID=A0ABX6YGQ0_9MICO|nr:hypothetical protein [Microbacterium chengjingii]QPZ37941.1 hypothetical protein HCR76_14195 [Microbacterium chengjingii]